MSRKAVQKPNRTVVGEAIPSTTLRAGTKESPILLSSDDESEREESTRRPLEPALASQKRHLGVSPSDAYTFRGQGIAYDMMIAMGYKPDSGLGPDLRGKFRPLSIELRKSRVGVGYRATSLSRSPSPPRKAPVKIVRPSKESVVPTPKLEPPVVKTNSQTMPVKIIRPSKEPVASTSKLNDPVAKATSQKSPQPKSKAQKSVPQKLTPPKTPLNSPTNPSKRSAPTQSLPSPPTVTSPLPTPPPPPPPPFPPSDLYISMMSGLAMANMPQTMQAAAAADPMAAFQFAQMCFAPPSAFSLPPFPLIPPQPDPVTTQPRIHPPHLPPKPVFDSAPKSNIKSTSDSSVTVEMDPLVLRQKRLARKNNIGWIPAPGFPDRGTFNLVPTSSYVHWSSTDNVTQPDPEHSLVMEDLPHGCRTVEFVRSWSDKFSAIAVHLNGGGKALIEFPSREAAEEAYDSPRLRDGQYQRATHVRVFWYRQQVNSVVPSLTSTAGGDPGTVEKTKDVLTVVSSTAITPPEEPISMDVDDQTPLAETSQPGKKVQPKGESKGPSLPPPGWDVPDVDPPVRPSTAPTSTPRPESPFVTTPSIDQDKPRQRSSLMDRNTNGSGEGSERTPSRPPTSPSPSTTSSSSCTLASSSHLPSPSPERTPAGSPPSLRYPSPTPEMTNGKSGAPSPSEETPAHNGSPPAITPGPFVAGDVSLERQLRMRLLAMKRTRMENRSSERSSSSSISSTVVNPEPEALFKVTSPQPIPQTSDGVVVSESLELLATSFITDTIQAAQGLSGEPERFDIAMKARLSKKRGSVDAFGSSADIAFKRQRLAQQIEESKRIMERWKAARTKEERNQIYALWEESNRSVELLSKPAAVPFQWPCYAERCLIIDSDDEEELMESL